ncbi:MAG TPA: YdeI/OmpD-associated family protein [Candidatus Acidoferrum sp.]|jgi:uncharacterized protein YdeI (YjbR/CyaY-like superfamily)|nr:YdeI/OmpD-associated family protein [Candidatus Acidoferrum sp.]
MPKKSPLVDAYIAKSADFAKPILNRIRKLVHAACPQVEEAIKWSSPFFMYKGVLVAMPAFKQHCALIFWKGKLILGKERAKYRRLTSLAGLPADKALLGYLRKAVELNEAGVKIPRPKSKAKIAVPGYLLAALKKNKKALATFEAFSLSHKREYVQWVTEAKREETRARRLKKMIAMLARSKSLHWKYE